VESVSTVLLDRLIRFLFPLVILPFLMMFLYLFVLPFPFVLLVVIVFQVFVHCALLVSLVIPMVCLPRIVLVSVFMVTCVHVVPCHLILMIVATTLFIVLLDLTFPLLFLLDITLVLYMWIPRIVSSNGFVLLVISVVMVNLVCVMVVISVTLLACRLPPVLACAVQDTSALLVLFPILNMNVVVLIGIVLLAVILRLMFQMVSSRVLRMLMRPFVPLLNLALLVFTALVVNLVLVLLDPLAILLS